MATYQYRIITTQPAPSTIETIQHNGADMLPWTHDTATTWAHVEGYRLETGTRIAIDRRRGPLAVYQPHRRYLVTDTGVRRTDR